MLGKNVLPLTSNSPLSSIFDKLPLKMRTAENNRIFLAAEAGHPKKRMGLKRKRSKAR